MKLAIFSAMIFAALTLSAADRTKAEPDVQFKLADINGDGFLTKEEFRLYFGKKDAAKAEKDFVEFDKDKDQKLSLQEYKALANSRIRTIPGNPI
jgi:hypothetical protein